jgi:hypothetical protein
MLKHVFMCDEPDYVASLTLGFYFVQWKLNERNYVETPSISIKTKTTKLGTSDSFNRMNSVMGRQKLDFTRFMSTWSMLKALPTCLIA